jgi:hypothetical protein
MADYLKNVFGGGSQAGNKPAANPDTGTLYSSVATSMGSDYG